jgi:thiamine biosynthesis protein ThiI
MTDGADIEEIKQASLILMEGFPGVRTGGVTFKAETRRADKRFPLVSQEVSAAVGAYILERLPVSVDLHNPGVTVWIEIRSRVYVYTEIIKCESGLPYASSGKGVLLLSGGLDSPVAGYLAARRGIEIIPVYFHSPPYTSERARDKVLDIAERLRLYTGSIKLYTVHFTEIQLYLYNKTPEAKLTLMLKRAMLRVASLVAAAENAQLIITGDSIGQVASQTPHSIAAVDPAASLPVLRPLCAMDKQQIIDIARALGTYEISIRPYEDCCTVFVPKHPEHKPSPAAVGKLEARHPALIEMYERAFAGAEVNIL